MKHGAFTLMVLAVLLTGCNRPPPEQTVFDDQLDTLDRARAVEEKLGDRAARIDERIDNEQEQKEPPQ